MRPVSAAWGRSVTGSHRALYRATVCTSWQTGTTPTGTRIPILGGDVVVDGTADVRSTLDLTTDGIGMWPTRADSLLTPYGNEIYVERGIEYTDSLVEYVGLGYFRIQDPEQDEAPRGPIRLTGRDRMAGIVDGRLLSPQQFAATASLGFIVSTLVQQVYPAATIEWDDATNAQVITRSLIADDDRFTFLDDLIKAQGKIWYWDYRGVLVVKTAPNPATPVFEVSAGEGGVLLTLGRKLTRDRVYNAVVASGEATDTFPPVRAVAYDNNPNSPTYFSGRFGPVPRFFTSPFLFTPAQARSAAEAELRRGLGLPYTVDLKAAPNPALEPWDPLAVRAGAGERLETHVLEQLTIPLSDGDAMTASTREQTLILVGIA